MCMPMTGYLNGNGQGELLASIWMTINGTQSN